MAATSPYTQNDYQAVSSFRPHQLAVNDIFKAVTAQNAFWDQGAARVKNVYDNISNLKLTHEENRLIRDNFLKEAEKQLTKLSSMDLSDPAVQRQGLSIFKPLYQDEGIVSDDAATRHIEKVNADALSYRGKDGGKNYSQYNHQYAMLGANEFATSTDRMSGKAYLSKKKEYEPYYDYTEDYTKALKDCKPSSISTESPYYGGDGKTVTGYSHESKSKALAASQARVCLEAGLSAKAQRQMQIEGTVNYAGKTDVLAADASSYLSSVSENISDQVQQLSAQRSAIRTNKNLAQKDKDVALASIDEQIKGLSDQIVQSNTLISKFNKGDYTAINENPEAYAGSVYTFRKLYKKAMASQYSEVEDNYAADPVQLQMKKYEQEVHLRELDHNYDISMENLNFGHEVALKQMDIMGDLLDGTGGGKGTGKNALGKETNQLFTRDADGNIIPSPNLQWLTPNLSGDAPTKDAEAYKKVQDELSTLNTQNTTNTTRLSQEILNKADEDPEFKSELMSAFTADSWENLRYNIANNRIKGGGIQNSQWFKTYFETHKDDPVLNRWAEESSQIELGRQTLNKRVELAEKKVSEKLGLKGSADKALEEEVKSINVKGAPLDATEVLKAINGNSSRLKIVDNPFYRGNIYGATYTLDGKKIDGKDFAGSALEKLLVAVKNKVVSTNNKVKDARAEVYGDMGFTRDRWALHNDDTSATAEAIQRAFGTQTDSGEFKPNKGIAITGVDFSGGIRVTHPGATKGNQDLLAKYRNIVGVGTDVEVEDGFVTLRGTNYAVIPKAIDNPTMKHAAYNLGTVGATKDFAVTPEGGRVENTDITIPTYIAGKRQEIVIKTYKINNNPEFRVFIPGSTDPRAKITASTPLDLMEKIARMKLDFKQPIK